MNVDSELLVLAQRQIRILFEMREIGLEYHSIRIKRGGLNPFFDILTLFDIIKLISKYKPYKVVSYTVKPVIYSGLACIYKNYNNYFPMITGLGYAFTEGKGFKRFLIKNILKKLYKISLIKAKKVIFQNEDDLNYFYDLNIIRKKGCIVDGSGVDISYFSKSPLGKEPVFLMLSRILKDKGVIEYMHAASLVKLKYPNAIFNIGGRLDSDNPTSIKKNEFEKLLAENPVNYLGNISNVLHELSLCQCYVLPSYREGLPRSTLEAMAVGRPIITTNVPGCRQTTVESINGFLVEKESAKELANAIIKFIEMSQKQKEKMACKSHEYAISKFDVKKVNNDFFKILKLRC